MAKCQQCDDTGVIETGNNDLPCHCPAGATALFSTTGVEGSVTGAELQRHFLNGSPEPINPGKESIKAADLPSRKQRPLKMYFLEEEQTGSLRCVIAQRKPDRKGWKVHRERPIGKEYFDENSKKKMEDLLQKAFGAGASWGRNYFK